MYYIYLSPLLPALLFLFLLLLVTSGYSAICNYRCIISWQLPYAHYHIFKSFTHFNCAQLCNIRPNHQRAYKFIFHRY